MSTRANITIKDQNDQLFFYRHSDGYPECCGEDLKEFVQGYVKGIMRHNVMQSAGHLIVRGHNEYKNDGLLSGHNSWQVGAYEPTTEMHGDVDYVYEINLSTKTITCNGKPYFNFGPAMEMDRGAK